MLNHSSSAFAELPSQMQGRPVMWRQTSFCFYRPGALAIANTIADIPFSAPKTLAFCIIVESLTSVLVYHPLLSDD